MDNKLNLGNSISKMFQTNIKDKTTTEDIYDPNKKEGPISSEASQSESSPVEPSLIESTTDKSSILNNSKSFFGKFGWFSISMIISIIIILIIVLYFYINSSNHNDFFTKSYDNIMGWFGHKNDISQITTEQHKTEDNTKKDEKLDDAINTDKDKDKDYNADDSYSSIQGSKSSNKSGWCYIGEDRGFRTCAFVNEDDKCMSGSIFPSKDICMNPNLRV
jgi:hypothetical protein